jgi:hypothetical protein
MYQMVLNYTNIFHCNALQNTPKLGVLVWKYKIWQPWSQHTFHFASFNVLRFETASMAESSNEYDAYTSGLPDVIFAYWKSQFGHILEGLQIENVG